MFITFISSLALLLIIFLGLLLFIVLNFNILLWFDKYIDYKNGKCTHNKTMPSDLFLTVIFTLIVVGMLYGIAFINLVTYFFYTTVRLYTYT